jgi:hypothetical protein
MALFDTGNPQFDTQDALIGRPSLRRKFAALDPNQRAAISTQLGQQIDPSRFKGAYRDALAGAIDNTNAAAPLNDRDKLNTLLRDPGLDPAQRSAYNQQLSQLPNSNSVAGRFDPRDRNSVAFRQFGNLYRTF